MAALSNYLQNKIIDMLRGQAFTWPATVYVALYTSNPTAADVGTEVSGGSYARAAIASSLAAWAGTQGAGTTAASTGTSGATSNNAVITVPTPTVSEGTASYFGVRDALTGGNLLYFAALSSPQPLGSGNPVNFPVAALGFTIA